MFCYYSPCGNKVDNIQAIIKGKTSWIPFGAFQSMILEIWMEMWIKDWYPLKFHILKVIGKQQGICYRTLVTLDSSHNFWVLLSNNFYGI